MHIYRGQTYVFAPLTPPCRNLQRRSLNGKLTSACVPNAYLSRFPLITPSTHEELVEGRDATRVRV